MLKAYKFRIYPTSKQTHIMNMWLEECRWLYNYFLEQRKKCWEIENKSLSYYAQNSFLVETKELRSSLKNIHSQVLQDVLVRLDLSFKAFFRRIKAGDKPGYPRFKGFNRYHSFSFPQFGFKITEQGLKLSKIGTIKIKLHRNITGQIKTCCIKKSTTGKWYVTFSCIVEKNPLLKTGRSVGIDVGLESFATLSDGVKIDNPRFFKHEEKSLAKAQRKFSKLNKGTPERAKARKVVAKIHERISNKRNNFAHQQSNSIVKSFDTICMEDLSINEMVHTHTCINKSISDVAWGQFTRLIAYKAECADKRLILVNPAYTSQICSSCGHKVLKKLSDRTHNCPCCGLSLDRDHNAAINILRLGLQSLASA